MNAHVNTLKWLLRREYWENRGSMLWAPAIVATLLVVLLGGAAGVGISRHGLPDHVYFGSTEVPHSMLAASITDDTRDMLAHMVASNYLALTSPLLAILAGVSFFYCLGALYDERRDRSILFWKSLPVSDAMTVLSKVATAVLLAPAITIGLITVSSLLLLLLACGVLATMGVNIIPQVLASSSLYLAPLSLLAVLPVYAVWALPTVGWLLLVSSWARTKPFLWAVMAPLVGLLIVKWISLALGGFGETEQDLMHFAKGIVARLLGGLIPGFWLTFDGQQLPPDVAGQQGIVLGNFVGGSWKSLASLDAWTGAVAGVAMLAGAARLRRWRDEG